jgi:NDP-sugar pyrophosphorylase family protein
MLDQFFDLDGEPENFLFAGCQYPWQALSNLKSNMHRLLEEVGPRFPQGGLPAGVVVKGDVHIEDGVHLEENIFLQGPCYLAAGAEVRFGAYIRGDVYVGAKAVVGHDTEVKHSILLPGAKAAHFAYVGDSILGREVNLGAGTKLANVRVDMSKQNLQLTIDGQKYDSGLRKFGAILGNGVSIGCNSVTSPGTLVGRDCLVYSLTTLAGYTPPRMVVKLRQQQVVTPRHSV